MWQLVNRTCHAAERCFTRDRDGAEVWLVAVKGTFDIHPDGSTSPAVKQESVHGTPVYSGEPGRSSLRYEADLIWLKPGTDVIVHGHAHAPGRAPTRSLDVGLKIGDRTKVLRIFGDRYWQRGVTGLSLSTPEPFTTMPIVYERAYGGIVPASDEWERRNPVGVGFAVDLDSVVGKRAPKVEDPGELIASYRQRPRPAGFGPIARDWSPRRELAGMYDERWKDDRMPLLPLDFDERFHYAAPEDQRIPGYLREGTTIELHHLTPGARMRFALPRVRPTFRTLLARDVFEHRPRLHTVIVEPDVPRVMMVWHTSLPCHGKEHELEKTIIEQKEYV